MRRIKIFHINYIPVAGGLGGVELDCRVLLTKPTHCLQYHCWCSQKVHKMLRSRIEINWSLITDQGVGAVFIVPGVTEKMCNYFGSLKHENVPLGYGKMRPSLLFWTIKILKTVLILSIRLLSYQQSKEKYEPKNFMTLALQSGINIGGEYNDNFKIKSCLAPRKTDWKGWVCICCCDCSMANPLFWRVNKTIEVGHLDIRVNTSHSLLTRAGNEPSQSIKFYNYREGPILRLLNALLA